MIRREQAIPIWPTKAVSTKDVTGSAAKASAAGNAMDNISHPSSLSLNPSLRNQQLHLNNNFKEKSIKYRTNIELERIQLPQKRNEVNNGGSGRPARIRSLSMLSGSCSFGLRWRREGGRTSLPGRRFRRSFWRNRAVDSTANPIQRLAKRCVSLEKGRGEAVWREEASCHWRGSSELRIHRISESVEFPLRAELTVALGFHENISFPTSATWLLAVRIVEDGESYVGQLPLRGHRPFNMGQK